MSEITKKKCLRRIISYRNEVTKIYSTHQGGIYIYSIEETKQHKNDHGNISIECKLVILHQL